MSCRLDRIYLSSCLVPSLQSVQHILNTVSDHDLVKVQLSPISPITIGKGFWKLNTNLLNDADFCGKIKHVLFYASQEIPTDESVLTWWDNHKKDFKEIAVTHSKSLRHRQTAEYKALSAQYLSAEKSKQLDQMKTLKERLREMETKQWAGAQVRSRAHLLDQREQPSRYFYRKELQQGKKKTITKIIDSHGNVCNTSDSIRNVFCEFYHTLYTREEIDPVIGDMFLKDLPRLDPADAESLGRDVRLEEIETSIGQLENNKSPGPDGVLCHLLIFSLSHPALSICCHL